MSTSEAAAAADSAKLPRVVIIGGGFAGVAAARALSKSRADVILIDRRNHHVFQPLLYQVATSVIAPADIASPIRQLASKQKNLSVMMAEVVDIDRAAKTVDVLPPGAGIKKLGFDYLIVAPGVRPSYFGHNEFAQHAPSLKTISDAEFIRSKILGAYERAETADNPDERARLMRFVLVGAGPTGVELAASIAHLAHVTLRSNFRNIDPAETSILLVEAGPRILATFAESLARAAATRLEKLGVQIVTGGKVERVDSEGVIVSGKRIECATILWAAGVTASPIVESLEAATDRAGRANVGPHLNLPDDPAIFVVGDAASVIQDGRPVPGVAQGAIQQGRHAGRVIAARISGKESPRPFRYFDRGNMAVVGKNFALLERGSIRLSGALVWLVWAALHVLFLPQLQNRLRVQTQWLWSYFTGQRSSRLIPEALEAPNSGSSRSTPVRSEAPVPLARIAGGTR